MKQWRDAIPTRLQGKKLQAPPIVEEQVVPDEPEIIPKQKKSRPNRNPPTGRPFVTIDRNEGTEPEKERLPRNPPSLRLKQFEMN